MFWEEEKAPHSAVRKINGVIGVRVHGEQLTLFVGDGDEIQNYAWRSQVSWIGMENVSYAEVEPNLFTFWILNNGNLHIVCPYIPKDSSNINTWLRAIEDGKIEI